MKHGWPYSLLNAVAMLLVLVGAFSLFSHFSGQFRKGSAPELSLFGGVGLVILGILFLVLADLGSRLVRIETKLGTLPKDEFTDVAEHTPVQRPSKGQPQPEQAARGSEPETRVKP